MIAKAFGLSWIGIDPLLVTVETDIQRGIPKFDIVGLPHTSVREGRSRILSALHSAGITIRAKRITVNLAPASIPKDGAALDLSITLSLLVALGTLPQALVEECLAFAELSLDGTLKPVRGFVSAALFALAAKKNLVTAAESVIPIPEIKSWELCVPKTLSRLIESFREGNLKFSFNIAHRTECLASSRGDWLEVRGQPLAKRAFEIAAAGHHNVVLAGPPGIGKSFLSQRFSTILPPMQGEERLEVLKIRSLAGCNDAEMFSDGAAFRAPHHHASVSGMIGGGRPFRPGEFTLAHGGVLFLDEFPEYRRDILEALREPLETRTLRISRLEGTFILPARFILVAAMNLCPCGALGDISKECLCTPPAIHRYQRRISAPIRDRIDLWVTLAKPSLEKIFHESSEETSDVVRRRVELAQHGQRDRNLGRCLNGILSSSELRKCAGLTASAQKVLIEASSGHALSVRSVFKVTSVSRTIADLEGSVAIEKKHVLEALSFRGLTGAHFS